MPPTSQNAFTRYKARDTTTHIIVGGERYFAALREFIEDPPTILFMLTMNTTCSSFVVRLPNHHVRKRCFLAENRKLATMKQPYH